MRKQLIGAFGFVFSLLLLAGVAQAEGSWNSNLNARSGFSSRSWTDNDIDAVSTSIQFDGCRDSIMGNEPNDRAEVQLTRETPWWQPDENRGRKLLWCFNSATGFWGDQPAGSYHFTIISVSGITDAGNILTVPFLQVNY